MVRLMVEEEEERGLIDVDDEDRKVFNWEEPKDEEAKKAAKKGKEKVVIEISDDEEDDVPDWDDDGPMIISKSNSTSSTSKFGSLKSKLTSFASSSSKPKPPKDDWKHDAAWVSKCTENLFPPPVNAAPSATNAVQRELRSMLKEQKDATSLKELGWYFPEEFIGDNLFQWIVEMHSFDPELPIAKDMKEK
jgi:ubiquitin-conjugating enzyme E2 Q